MKVCCHKSKTEAQRLIFPKYLFSHLPGGELTPKPLHVSILVIVLLGKRVRCNKQNWMITPQTALTGTNYLLFVKPVKLISIFTHDLLVAELAALKLDGNIAVNVS